MTLESLNAVAGSYGPYLALILFGFLPSEIWRWIAVVLAKDIKPNSEILEWVRAVSTALLCGVVAKLVLVPPGALAIVPLPMRLSALVGGCLVFWVFKRNIPAGVAFSVLAVIGYGLVQRPG